MNWILGLVGALIGIAVSESRWLLGAVVGFCALYFLGAHMRLRHRMDAMERDLKTVRTRNNVEALRTETMAHAQTASEPSAAAGATPTPEPASPLHASPIAAATMSASATQTGNVAREPPPLPAMPSPVP
ncbi:MAG: hypothetical protein ABIT64_04145, partial [Lysobacteraceae bacterium]